MRGMEIERSNMRQPEDLAIEYEFVEETGAAARLQKAIGFLIKKLEEKKAHQERALSQKLSLSNSVYRIRKEGDFLLAVDM